MEQISNCILCDKPAETEISKGTGGNRLLIYCTGSCPTYEITTRAISILKNKPNRKSAIIEKICAFHMENPNDLPVIRMTDRSQVMEVTTRKRESEEIE